MIYHTGTKVFHKSFLPLVTMGLIFEWDINKAQTNLTKHKVSFEEAATIFADEDSLTIVTSRTQPMKKEALQWDFRLQSGFWFQYIPNEMAESE